MCDLSHLPWLSQICQTMTKKYEHIKNEQTFFVCAIIKEKFLYAGGHFAIP
ncbi:hypothetical protein B4168_1528 [Anoxybacillus flavithermus]|nr:hypothetical protein B4168_1528 [Anoxybacillus flavithermus]OAO84183.1 hypothetical protein GT23_3718 [Parageobacillus thermoglucosidasius]